MSQPAYIAMGSNLGDRRAYLDQAVELIGQCPGIRVLQVSSYLETEPIGGPSGQGPYLNAAAKIDTSLAPRDLLHALQAIEQQLGRVREKRFGPRTLDLDLLLFGDLVLNDPELEIPHPRMAERRFVLQPLAEIAPLAVHPVRKSTILDLLRLLDSQLDLHGLRAIVTGSSSGIGRAIAVELSRGGAEVVIHAGKNFAGAEETARLCGGGKAEIILADLRRADSLASLVDSVWGSGIDIWINNAGADTLTGEAAHWAFERKLQELWQIDVQGTLFLSRMVGQRMKTRGKGVIVNMGWDQAETGMEGDSGELFAAAKGAIMAFSRSLALSLAPHVRVHCLAPGWIRTAWGEGASSYWQERVLRETPLARWGTPEDIARAARWLASPAARFLTGQIIRVNGGAVRA